MPFGRRRWQARVQAQLAEKKAAKAAEVAAQRASAEQRIQVRHTQAIGATKKGLINYSL